MTVALNFRYHELIEENYGFIDIDDAKYFLTQCTGVDELEYLIPEVDFIKTDETGPIYWQHMSVQRFVAVLEGGLNVWVSFGGTDPENLGPWVHINLHKYFNRHRRSAFFHWFNWFLRALC